MTRQVKGVVLSLYRVYWSDSQRPVVLSRFISAGAEERVDAFTERVIESVDVDFSIDVVERHLQKPRGHGVIGKPHLVTKEVWMFVIFCALGRQKICKLDFPYCTCPFSKSTNIPILCGRRFRWTSVEGSVRKAYLFLERGPRGEEGVNDIINLLIIINQSSSSFQLALTSGTEKVYQINISSWRELTDNPLVSQAEEPVSVAWGNFNLPLPVDWLSGHTQIPIRLPTHLHLFTGSRTYL